MKNFLDVIHRYPNKADIGFLYEDKIVDNQLVSTLKKEKEGSLEEYLGHSEIVFEN